MSEEEIFDGVIQNYIAENTTTEKYYTQKYVDEIKEERDKYKKVLDKIKEILKSNINFYEENFKLSNMTAEEFKKEHPYILGSYDDSKNLLERINELLEEIE